MESSVEIRLIQCPFADSGTRVQSDVLNRVQESRGKVETEIRKLLHEVSRIAEQGPGPRPKSRRRRRACGSGGIESLGQVGHSHDHYQAPIGYVSHPKLDKRGQHFVSADVQESRLGISAIFLPCESLRDYCYRLRRAASQNNQPNFHEALCIPASASLAELRLGYKLRTLELVTAFRRERLALDPAFNIIGQPELRACYDYADATTASRDRLEAPAVRRRTSHSAKTMFGTQHIHATSG